MYESDAYPFATDTITRTLYFARPLVTTKIKLDKMIGAAGFVIQVEFFGMDQPTKERHFSRPFEGGKVFKSETTWSELCKIENKLPQDQIGSLSMTTNLDRLMETQETTGV